MTKYEAHLAAIALSARGHQERPVVCAVCGATFAAFSPKAITCSNKCRQRRKYAKQRQGGERG